MRVRMKVDVSGTRNGGRWPRKGQEIDLPAAEAADLCAAGHAERVADDDVIERAVAPRPEKRAAARRKA